jgi:AcrR family transcriptional regulator
MTTATITRPTRSRTDDAKLARRSAILAAARRVLARRGLRGTTVGDIAREANVAVGTLYLYFPSKGAVFAALHDLLFDTIDSAVRDAAARADDVLSATRASVRAAFDACWRNRDLLRLIVMNTDPQSSMALRLQQSNRRRTEPLAELLRRGMTTGVIREDHPETLARMINGLVSYAIYDCYVLGEGEDATIIQDVLARLIATALTPERRRETSHEG